MKSLQILIPSLPERHAIFNALCTHLNNQIGDRNVSILTDVRDRFVSIGKKRDDMLKAATADYVTFLDDDDMVTHDYVSKIYDAIQSGCDVVGFRGYMTTNRQDVQTWCISIRYNDCGWNENNPKDGFRYVRCPNHLAPIKLEHARAAGFKDMGHGEDYDYSMRLKNLNILRNEFFIDQELYHYIFQSKK